jgi:hypothetical protein
VVYKCLKRQSGSDGTLITKEPSFPSHEKGLRRQCLDGNWIVWKCYVINDDEMIKEAMHFVNGRCRVLTLTAFD